MSRATTALIAPRLDGTFEFAEIYLNQIQADEVLVEIQASGICHTDLACAAGKLPCAKNAVLGHEGAGTVLDTGPEVTNVSKGDKVLLSFSYCGNCFQCQDGHPAYCYDFNKRNFGGKRPDGTSAISLKEGGEGIYSTFFGQSSFARHTLVHKSSCVKVPADTDLELYAPLGCGIQTGAGAVLNSLNVREGSTLAVFGVGSVGMAAVMAGKIRGCRVIIAVDLQQSRLDLAREMGATHGILGTDGDVLEQIRKIVPPVGVDFAVDGSGVPAVIRMMIDSLGSRGRCATIGAPGLGKTVAVDVSDHLAYGKEYIGCSEGDSNPPKFVPYLIEQHKAGKLPLEKLVSVYDVKDFEQAVKDTHDGNTLKAVLRWS